MSSPGAPPGAPTFEASKWAWIIARAVASSIEPPSASHALPAVASRRLERSGDLVAEGLDGRAIDLREGGEGLDRVGEHVERDAGADGQRRLLQPLPRLRAQRVRAREAFAV